MRVAAASSPSMSQSLTSSLGDTSSAGDTVRNGEDTNKLPTKIMTVTGGDLKVTRIKTPVKKRESLGESFQRKEKTEVTDMLESEFTIQDYDIFKFRKDFMSADSDWAVWKVESRLFADAVLANQEWANEKNHKAYKKEFVDEFERSVFDDFSRNAKNDSCPAKNDSSSPAKNDSDSPAKNDSDSPAKNDSDSPAKKKSLPRNCFGEHDPRTCYIIAMDENDGMPTEVQTAIQDYRDLIPAIFLSALSRVLVTTKFTTMSTQQTRVGTDKSTTKVGTNKSTTKVGTNKSTTKVGTNKSTTKVGTDKNTTKVGPNKMKLHRVMQVRQIAMSWGSIGKKEYPLRFSQTIEGEEIEGEEVEDSEEHRKTEGEDQRRKTSLKIKWMMKMDEANENMGNTFPIYALDRAMAQMLKVWKDEANAMINHLKGEKL